MLAFSCGNAEKPPSSPANETGVVIVGAGISGLSAALEAAGGGAPVTVVDMFSVFGGHAVMSQGGLCIVGTPLQEEAGIADSPQLAYRDFMTWGEDADSVWVRYYVENSREEIYEWLTGMGVAFEGVGWLPGNTVSRFHRTSGRGLMLVSAIYRECLAHPNISFQWNTRIDGLIIEGERVCGVRGTLTRSGEPWSIRARAVILATGGFQSNLDLVRTFWPKDAPFPERILAGSGINSTGSGLDIAREAGGVLHNMDHQWNYVTGLPDPRFPGENRGLNASNRSSIWVNVQGERFVNEWGGTKVTFPALLRQKPSTYWAIFDEAAKSDFFVSGSDWGDFERIETFIFDNADLVKSASTIPELARLAGLPPDTLDETVRNFNAMVESGEDTAFGRFRRGESYRPPRIDEPPFYAVRFFPLSRKSMGGIMIDTSCRVVDEQGLPVPGLYAVGEATGFAGINGSAGLEGTFLGPSIITGRVAGRTVLADYPPEPAPSFRMVSQALSPDDSTIYVSSEECLRCHDLRNLTATPHPGYWHFEKTHEMVLERMYSCYRCHPELGMYFEEDPDTHRIDRLRQIEVCTSCHVSEERIP